jgi:hypothetical protein
MHPDPSYSGPDAITIAFQKPGAKVFAGSLSSGSNSGSLFDDLKVNGVGEDVLT